MIKPTKYQNILCSLPEEMIEQLDNISKNFGMTRIGVIRLLLSEGIKTYYNYQEKGGN